MEKDLKGSELGRKITRESTGLYSARLVDRFGKKKSNVIPAKWPVCNNKYDEIP